MYLCVAHKTQTPHIPQNKMMIRIKYLVVSLLLFFAACTSTQPTGAGGALPGVASDTLTVSELPGGDALSASETVVVQEAAHILKAPQFAEALLAMKEGTATELKIAERTILLEPDAPLSGMTLFEEGGFVIGKEALASTRELYKTVLHELYRLHMSESSEAGVNSDLVSSETEAAFNFAEKAVDVLIHWLQ